MIRGQTMIFESGNIELSYDYLVEQLKVWNINTSDVSMLDIGTNFGTLPHMVFKNLHVYMDGADIRDDTINTGKENYSEIADHLFVVGDNLRNIEDRSYDIVTMFDVIEHIPDVEDYLKNDVYRILKPGGMLIFQTPNGRINPIYETINTKSLTKWKKYHCSLQTPGQLRRLLDNAGFINIKIEKNTLDSVHNRNKLRKKIGAFAGVVLFVFQRMPLGSFPNLWGVAQKRHESSISIL